jgi:hypothetical protein
MKEGFFYYLRAGFGLCCIFVELIWAILVGLGAAIVSGVLFVLALTVSTLKPIGAAAYGVLIEDCRDRKCSVTRMDCPPGPPPKPTAKEINTARLRREQRLIQQFKTTIKR